MPREDNLAEPRNIMPYFFRKLPLLCAGAASIAPIDYFNEHTILMAWGIALISSTIEFVGGDATKKRRVIADVSFTLTITAFNMIYKELTVDHQDTDRPLFGPRPQ